MAMRYRDTETGKFVKQSTFNRSRAHGGHRYIETEIKQKPKKEPIEDYGYYDEPEYEEWAITFSYGEDE